MDERFIALATMLRPTVQSSAARCVETEPPVSVASTAASVARDAVGFAHDTVGFAHEDAVHRYALARLAVLEAFEASAADMLNALACDVLARELLLAPADIDALVERAVAAYLEHEPVGLVLSPADAGHVRTTLPVRVDPSLEAGDLVVDVRDGTLESRFVFRLQTALERATHSRCAI